MAEIVKVTRSKKVDRWGDPYRKSLYGSSNRQVGQDRFTIHPL